MISEFNEMEESQWYNYAQIDLLISINLTPIQIYYNHNIFNSNQLYTMLPEPEM